MSERERESCPVLQQFVLIYKRLSSPCLRHEGIYASGEVQPYPFLTSPLDGKRPVSRAGRFTPGKNPTKYITKEAGWASEPAWTI
jgi:hypothetical protein